jgi:hypothetical protein
MKNTETFIKCEFCGKYISLQSPPSKKNYNNAEIRIEDGIILLPNKIVKKHHKEGITDGHANDLSGYYCTPKCLYKRIEQILK